MRLPSDCTEEQIERLRVIAAKCPVHRTLDGEVNFDERIELVAAGRRLVDDRNPGRAQLFHRPLAVARRNLDRAGRTPVHDHVETGPPSVERGGLDAVVEREPGNVDGVDAPLA